MKPGKLGLCFKMLAKKQTKQQKTKMRAVEKLSEKLQLSFTRCE